MNGPALQTLMTEARNCAMAMLGTGTFVQRELPNIQIDSELRSETERLCSELIATKHDILSELSELDDLISTRADEKTILARTTRMVQWLSNDIQQLHNLLATLEAAAKRNSALQPAHTLVSKSSATILDSFHRAKHAADSLQCPPNAR